VNAVDAVELRESRHPTLFVFRNVDEAIDFVVLRDAPREVDSPRVRRKIGEAELRVHDLLVVDEDEVVEAAAAGQTHRGERLHVAHEAEGARRGDLGAERVAVVMRVRVLLAPHRRRVDERVVDAEAV